jgi:hypothetical protein
MIRASAVAVLLVHISIAATGDPLRIKVLADLQAAFKQARELPRGSRPSPPRSLNIDALIGIQPDVVRASLGTPDYEGNDLLNCGASRCWAFRYGPERKPPLERDVGDGRKEIVISTGGPWLLLVAIENDSITAARWRGQR